MKSDFSLARSPNSFEAGFRMRHDDLRVLLEHRRDFDDGHVLLDGGERPEQVALHVELDLSAQQHGLVGLGDDVHLQAVFLVGAVDGSLVEPAMLGLRHPVGAEGDLVDGQCRAGERESGGANGKDECRISQDAHVDVLRLPCGCRGKCPDFRYFSLAVSPPAGRKHLQCVARAMPPTPLRMLGQGFGTRKRQPLARGYCHQRYRGQVQVPSRGDINGGFGGGRRDEETPPPECRRAARLEGRRHQRLHQAVWAQGTARGRTQRPAL